MYALYKLLPVRTLRDAAYLCFLGLAAVVVLTLLLYALGPLLPQSLGAAVVVFVLLPVSGAGLLAATAGVVLTVVVRRDLRLYALSVVAATLLVFWVRRDALGLAPAWAALYIFGALLFSLRWLAERSREGMAADSPANFSADSAAGETASSPGDARPGDDSKRGPFE